MCNNQNTTEKKNRNRLNQKKKEKQEKKEINKEIQRTALHVNVGM